MLSLWRHPEVLYEALADIPVWGGWISSVFINTNVYLLINSKSFGFCFQNTVSDIFSFLIRIDVSITEMIRIYNNFLLSNRKPNVIIFLAKSCK